MKTVLIIWGLVMVYCVIEAIFFTRLDPESRKFLKERENELNKEKNGNNRNS